MNQIPIYQHPFVDVFKATKLTEWSNGLAQKEGDVTEIYDKELAKNVLKVNGVTTASNYFQLPASKHLPKKALGLTGKYNLNGNSLQVPIILPYSKWTMICVNIFQLLSDNQVFAQGQKQAFFMRSFQVTANLQIKGVYTSDIKYTVQTLPKEMAMKNTRDKDWFAQYAWIDYPSLPENSPQEQQQEAPKEKENTSNNSQKATRPRSIIKQKNTVSQKPGLKSQKSVKFNQDSSSKKNQDLEEVKGNQNNERDQDDELQRDLSQQFNQEQFNVEETLHGKDGIEKTVSQIEEIKQTYDYNLQTKNINTTAQVTIYQNDDSLPKGKITRTSEKELTGFGVKQGEKFILKPNPIMRLDRVIGMHPKYQSGQIFYNKDPKLSRELLYTQANLLLGYYPPTQRQRLFYDHQTNTIEFLYVSQNLAFSGSKSTTAKQENNPNALIKDYEICIWDISDASQIFSFKPPLMSIHSISVNSDQTLIALGGKDFQKRDLILVYMLSDMIKYKKVELYARQLSDFDLVHLRFNDVAASSLISSGKENIRLYKIKNNHLPGQSVTLNNTGRGKVFNHTIVDYTLNEKNQKKPNYVYTTTACGLLYFINYNTRQIDKIIQIHEDKITAIKLSPERNFCVTTSINGVLRIWSNDFSKLISEVNTQQAILDCDINVNQKEISVLSQQGTVSILDLEQSSFNVLMRSHQENLVDLCFNQATKKLVTIALDQCIKIWNAETMELENEFTTQNDNPIKISSSALDCTVAVGFKSGFVRIFDLQQNKLIAETMIYESPVMDLQFSQDNKFLAIFFKSSRIVIFNVEKGYQPIKTIDYDFPNDNYFSLSFSPDGKYMANISSNANNITIWETRNFSLKFHLDLTGDLIQKIKFAPNSKDFVILTTSSKLKFYRITFSELLFIKEAYGVTDMECLDFEISSNNKFIFCAGREGVIKVYDYFMRGDVIASSQAFLGHFKFPTRIIAQDDLRFIYSIGEGNGVYRWNFYGDQLMPDELFKYFEEIQDIKKTKIQQVTEQEPVFEADKLLQMTQEQLQSNKDQVYNESYANEPNAFDQQLTREFDPLLISQQYQQQLATIQKSQLHTNQVFGLSHEPTIQYNKSGYRFEQYDIELKKVLSCSTGSTVNNNLVWNQEMRYIAYTSSNIVIVEDLNQEKTQRLLKEGNDKIYELKLSPNGRMLLAFTKEGKIDGFPVIYIWDAATLKKLNTLAINDSEIMSVDFSAHSNMLLVVSRSLNNSLDQSQKYVSTISIWDFLEGHKDILCKSHLPMNVIEGKWNIFLPDSNEFVTISERRYHYWKISNTLNLCYQEGDIPKKKDPFSSSLDTFNTIEFVVPTPEQISVYLLIGLNTGYVWVCDSRSNQFIYQVKVIDSSIRHVTTSHSKIIIEGINDTVVHCWPQGVGDFDKSDPQSFFMGKEITLTLDGFPKSSSYEESGNQCMMSTTSGTIWLMSWVEMATVKLKSCHNPQYQINTSDFKYIPPSQFQIYQEQDEFYQFDQNYMIASSGKDGIIKLWNMYDCEFVLQFIVPKEECVAIAMHQFKPFMVCSFTDGFLRFFEINKSKNLGRCQIYSDQEKSITDYLVQIKILPSGNHILGASKNGQIILVYVQQWDPLAIKIEQIASINTSVHTFDVSFLEPYNKWLVGTANGKVIVYNRKDFNSFQQEIFTEDNPPKFNFMDSFNLLDYVDNNFTESKRCNTLDHYYSISKRNMVYNEVQEENFSEGIFSNADLSVYVGYIRKCNSLFIRNFELHQVVKKIELNSLPLQLSLSPNSSFFIVLQQGKNVLLINIDGVIKMIDWVNESNASAIQTIHEQAKMMRMCPNGRYILTGGDSGDICLWAIKRKSLENLDI